MSDSPDPRLERTAEAVADSQPLDWEREQAERPGLRPRLEGLRVLARLAAAHRQARAELGARPGTRTEEAATAAASEPPAFVWGFLRVLSRLGAGSFGEVWRAYDPTLHREVALKLRRLDPLPAGMPALAMTSDPSTRRSVEEARQLARVRHPNVLTVFGAAEHDGRVGMWTELVRGETLGERLERSGPLAARAAAAVGVDLCGALAAVHAAGLLHGDVKAANVMLEPLAERDAPPRVVLMDFGAAHQRGAPGGAPGRAAAGTPLVMAPEVLAGLPPSARSDLYAAGVPLYLLVSGRYPVEAPTLDELRAKHERGERVPLARARPGVPARLARVVERAMAARPEDRFTSADEMRRALKSFAEPARGRRTRLLVAGSIAATLAALAIAFVAFQHPALVRYVPPERLPGPQVPAAMRFADAVVGTVPGERFGEAEAGVGDVNGDGFDDIMVAATYFSGTANLQGRAMLYLGNRSGRFGAPAWTAVGRGALDQLGARVAPAGDVNGDGYADVLVLDELYREPDHRRVGAISLYLGSPSGLAREPASRLVGWQPQSEFGSGLAGVGDVNGDG
ncbi:MAG: protein kinase, partial [Candidatus Eisenbacteria bacterium]|nr:protein kinase [Candidatus Eisenbacteria bacterium]